MNYELTEAELATSAQQVLENFTGKVIITDAQIVLMHKAIRDQVSDGISYLFVVKASIGAHHINGMGDSIDTCCDCLVSNANRLQIEKRVTTWN